MKTSILIVIVFLLSNFAAFAQGPSKMKRMSKKMEMPYEAEYSSKFKIGEDRHSLKVLELWKDFEENELNRHMDHFAENLVMDLSDGTRIEGRDKVMEETKGYRGNLSTYLSKVTGYVSLQSVDKNEDWVAIWGEDSFTDAEGNSDTASIHEIWRFNKEGKVDYIRQYLGKPVDVPDPEMEEDDEW
jgi:hypothetical protein